MIYEVEIKATFSAAHYLRSYHGNPEKIHGHNWAVEAVIGAERIDDEWMVIDFVEARKMFVDVLEKFDHRNINDMPEFSDKNPTAEAIAELIFKKYEILLKKHGAFLKTLTLRETPDCAVTLRRE